MRKKKERKKNNLGEHIVKEKETETYQDKKKDREKIERKKKDSEKEGKIC